MLFNYGYLTYISKHEEHMYTIIKFIEIKSHILYNTQIMW